MRILVAIPKVLFFVGFIIRELVLSTLRVAWEVVTPAKTRSQAIIAVPLDVKSDLEIALLANLITFTPGTLSLDVSSDRSVLYVHTMFIDDPEQLRRDIKQGFERRVIDLVRGGA
jgi:multicomponent Na+:H+ antiporter subunit E